MGAKVKPFSESAKSNDIFSPDPPPKKNTDALVGEILSQSVNRSWIAFAVTKVLLFSLQPNLSKSFFLENAHKTSGKGKTSPMKKTENTGIYIIRFARVREKKGLKEEENEKKKISSAKRLFSRKCWRLIGNKGRTGERKVSKKTEVINRTSRNSNRKPPESQTKIHQKWRENIFGPVRDFFNSRTKTKFFSDHVLQPEILRISQTETEMTESLGKMKAEYSDGAKRHKTNIKQTLPKKNAKFVGLHIIIAFET